MLPDTEVGLETPRELNIFLFSFPRPLALAVRKHPEIRDWGGWQHRCADEGREGVLWVPWPVHRDV